MLGLKLIKESEYVRLQREIDDAQALLAEKYGIISSLEKEIVKLKKENDKLKKEELPKKKDTKTILLTDVAEEPLKVEEKPKRRRATRVKKEVITK